MVQKVSWLSRPVVAGFLLILHHVISTCRFGNYMGWNDC